MALNLREYIATNGLKLSIEGNFGLPVVLIDPDGVTIDTNEVGDPLKGQVLYDKFGIDPETGDEIIIDETSVSLRKTALSRVPVAGERWKIKFPLDPSQPDVLTIHLLTEDHAPVDGGSIAFIKLLPQSVEQS
jgi:hypothetical protein